MSAIRGTIREGKVVFNTPPGWPEGKEVFVIGAALLTTMTEDEQGDDPESIARWLSMADAIPVADSSPFDEPAVVAWREAMRNHNLEAVQGGNT